MIALWLASAAARAAEPVPVDRAVLVLLRALAYDRRLAGADGPLRVGVACPTRAEAELAAAAVSALRGVTVAGRPLAAPVPWAAEGGGLPAAEDLDAVLLCPGLGRDLGAVAAAAERAGALSLALDGADVGRGAALGVSAIGGRLQLRVDAAAAARAGAELSGELLDLAVRVGP